MPVPKSCRITKTDWSMSAKHRDPASRSLSFTATIDACCGGLCASPPSPCFCTLAYNWNLQQGATTPPTWVDGSNPSMNGHEPVIHQIDCVPVVPGSAPYGHCETYVDTVNTIALSPGTYTLTLSIGGTYDLSGGFTVNADGTATFDGSPDWGPG